jgi:hypothetical protein
MAFAYEYRARRLRASITLPHRNWRLPGRFVQGLPGRSRTTVGITGGLSATVADSCLTLEVPNPRSLHATQGMRVTVKVDDVETNMPGFEKGAVTDSGRDKWPAIGRSA